MMRSKAFHQRAVVGSALTLEFVPRASDGEPRTPAAAPTVEVVRRSDGAEVIAGTVTAPDPGLTAYTADIAAAANNSIDELEATWTVDGFAHTRTVQVVGDVMFDIDTAEDDGHKVFPDSRPAAARRHRARAIAELECERITNRAWVPQMRQERVLIEHGYPELLVDQTRLRSLQAVTEHDNTGAVARSWTPEELAATYLHDYGSIERLSGCWPTGLITVTYLHGTDTAPGDLAEMVARRYVTWLAKPSSAVPDQAVSWSAADGGGTYRLERGKPGTTGVREIDNVYLDYADRASRIGIA